jgi:hypothetical protein
VLGLQGIEIIGELGLGIEGVGQGRKAGGREFREG